VAVTENATYTATFTATAKVKYYTITFVNYDGTQLQSGKIAEGEMPRYTGVTPTKPEDEQNTYTFSGWIPEIVAATEDATYTATYTASPKDQGIEDVFSSLQGGERGRLILHDGQIYILRAEKVYNAQGALVK
jgi:hemin uptake protein HemP